MPILEHEAWTVSEALNKGLLDESQKQQGAKLLTEYADQQDAQGLRLWPERERQQDERRSSLFATMEDPRKLDDSNGIFAAADSIRPGAGDEMRKRAANEMFLADRYNLPVEQARKQYDALTIDYGAQKWNEATQLEPSRFFDRAREEVKAEKTRFDHINLTADAAMRAAMRGDSDVQSFANWQAANPDLPGATREVWRSVRGEVDKRLGADGRAAASRAFRALQNATGTGENADAWWNEARRDLVTLRQNQPEKYKLALQAIQAMAEGPAKEKGVAQGTGESFARGVEMLTSNAMSAVEPLQAVAARWGITNADDPQALAAHLEAGNQVDSDLRDLANGVIDPVKPTGWLDKALYTTAGSLPMMLGAMVPGGMQTMAASFTNEAYADLRSNGWTGGDAFAAAALSGVFQSAVEMASEGLIHIPGVAGVLSKYGVKPGTNWGAQFLLRSAGRGAVEFGEEVIQQAATPFVQELAHAIMPSIPGTPEGKHLGDVMTEFFKKENSVPLLLSVLPLGMIGAAATTRQDARIIDAVTSNDTLLRSVFSDADAAAIAAEKDPVKRKAMIREKWVSQPTEEIAKRAAKVLGEERIKAANAARAFAQAERLGMIPTVRRDVQGWVVSTREGKPVRVETRQEAVELAYSHLSDLEYQSAAAMAQAADEFFIAGGAKGEAFEISKSGRRVQDEVDIGRVTPEQAAESIQVFGEMHGLTPEQAKAERLQVLGNNRAEEVEGVRTAVSRVFGGGNVITILHEGVHGRWRAGLESGHYTPQRGLAWVRMAEAASGQRFLATADDAAVSAEMLDEAITEVASADIIGRRKDGKTHFSAGLISRGVASFALAQRADAKEAGKLATFLKSWKEFWGRVLSNAKALKKARAEGKLGEDFDGFLDDLLGTEPQARHEAAAAKEAISLSALDEGTPFSLASLPPSASSKFFETPGRFYRVIVGDEAFRDIVSSGEVRTNAANKTREGMSLADRLAARPTAFPSFSKDAAAMSYAAQNPNHYIVISEDSSLQPSTEGRHSKGKTYFPTGKNGQHLKSLPSSSVAVYRHLENGNYDLVFLNGNVVTESNLAEIDNAPFSLAPQTPQDAEYMAAVEAGDMETAQRFNEQSNDIRYSLAPRSLASVADTVLASKMKSPEFREQFMALAVSRIAELRRDGSWRVDKQGRASQREGADSIADRTRSASSITKEAQYRRRARQRELIEQGMNTLTNETRLAYEHGLESVEDQPLIVDMLGKHGKLMSWSTANAQGRIGRMDGDYDGAPTLPPKWYSKGSGIMPDVMAQNLYDDGHLKEPTTGALWEALAGVIDGVKAQNADVKKAIAAVKEVQKNADTQAKSETEAWAKEARAKVPTAKERQMLALRTLDAILSAFPAVIRGRVGGFVKLASLGSDKAREAEIAKRIDILDNVVESEAKKHYQARVDKLIERARPKTASGKKPTGKLGADVHATFATIEQAMGWTEERAEAHASGLEAEIAAGTMTPEQEALAQTEASIVRLVADWNPRSVATNKNNVAGKPIYQRVHGGADAARMASAYEAMTALYEGSTLARAEQVAAQRERRQAVRNSLISATGNLGTAAQRDERTMKDNGLGGFFREAGLGLLNFEQVLEWTFGANAEALALSDWERMASNQKEDAIEAKTTAIERLFTGLAGGRLKGEKLRWQMSQKTMSVQGRMLSELEAITATLMWRQADGQRHMEGHLDEAGQPVGTWHYNQAFVDEIEGRLSADAKEVREFIADQYGQEWQGLNEVYARMYGVNLPQHANYAPLTVMPQTAPSGMGIDPVTGSVVSGTSTTPGGLKSRSGKIAEPDFRDALQTYIAHTRQMEHWKAYAELAQEGRLALANREVGNAVESATNKQARQVLAGWIDYWAEGGARDAASYLAVVQGLGKAANRVAAAALVGRVGTLAVQATQLGAAAAEMPFSAYTLRLAKLMTGQLGWGAALRSAYIQRRISQMPPVVQQAMAGLKASKPNALKHAMQKVGWLISGADGLFTAGTFAIVYDYQIGQAQSLGLTGAEAVAYAEQAAERATDRIAQPTRAGARSLFENKSTNPFVKLSWAFASEGRKNLGLLLASGKAGMTGPRFWRAVLFVSVLNSGLAYMIRSAMRDARDPGDDEVFDEDHWSLKRLALGMGTDWLQGLPVAGQILQGGAYKLAGEYAPEGNLFSSVGRSVAGWGRILSGESKDGMKDIDLILSGLAPFNDTISAASSASHLARDVKDAAVNFFGE